jgi:type I restriction enzyme S subunit
VSWPLVKIKNVAKVITGKTPSTSESKNFGGVIPFITPSELSNDKYIGIPKVTLSELGAAKIKLVPEGSVLVCCIGSLGKIGVTKQAVATNQQINTVCFNQNLVMPEYGYYALSRLKPKLQAMAPATTVAIVSKSKFEELEIPLPPLAEQKRIAAILDKADAIRRKRQQAIQLADDFLRAVFLDMFGDPVTNPKGWEVRELSELCIKITDGTHHSPPITKSGIPYVTAKHLKLTGLEFFNDPWFISEDSHRSIYSRCAPEKFDVLYIKDGATTGLAAINEYDFEFSMLSSLALIKPDKNKIIPEFLCVFLNHPRAKLVITANMAGAAITRLTLAKIKDIQIPLPSLSEQKLFADIYWRVKSVISKNRESKEISNHGFNALSQQAFSGKL